MLQIVLNDLNRAVQNWRHKLKHIPARGFNCGVLIEHYAKSADRRYLLAYCIVCRNILGNIPRNQWDLPDIRLFQPHILDYGEISVAANTGGNIKPSVASERNSSLCIASAAFNIAAVVGNDRKRTAGTAPVNAQCEGITLVLEQRAHDSARRAHSAECGGYYRGRLVQPFDLPYDISCINCGT